MGFFENNGKSVLVVWALGLVVFYLVAAYLAGTRVYDDRASSEIRQQ